VSYGIVKFSYLHPLEEFQKADYQVAIAHIIGHSVYGMLMGLVFGLLRLMGFDVSPGIGVVVPNQKTVTSDRRLSLRIPFGMTNLA
jgi:hypothetical protein